MEAQEYVYVVDDHELVRNTLALVLQSAGFNVQTFESAESFLQHPLITENACLVLDLRMPRVSGLDVQQVLSQRNESLPIIFYTGNADVSVTVRAMQAGAYTLLEKPISNELLIENIRKAIAKHRVYAGYNREKQKAETQLALLTNREKAIAHLLASGLSGPEVARQLFISARTVDAHRAKIFSKLEIKSVAKLAQLITLCNTGSR